MPRTQASTRTTRTRRTGATSTRTRSARRVDGAGEPEPLNTMRRGSADAAHDYIDPSSAETLLGQAVNVSEGKVVEDTVDDAPRPSNMHRVVVRQVEVPFTRKVKVPIKQTVIESVTVTKRVKVKRLVEVPSTKEVEEEYTEIAHRKKIVKKEVWVKKIVEEEVDEPYEVKKTRMITVPTTKVEEVEEWQTVEVQEDRKVEKDSFRIDEVEDTKLVEVQEEQVFELVPRALETHVLGANDMGVYNKGHRARHLGERVYNAEEVASIELDETPDHRAVLSAPTTRKQSMGIIVHASPEGTDGVIVSLVRVGYPGEAAGVREGDVITHVAGVPVHGLADFRTTTFAAGATVAFTITRDGQTKTLTAHKGAASDAEGHGAGAGAAASSSKHASAYESEYSARRSSGHGSATYASQLSANGKARA